MVFFSFIYSQLDKLVGRIEEKVEVIQEKKRFSPLRWLYANVRLALDYGLDNLPTDWEELAEYAILILAIVISTYTLLRWSGRTVSRSLLRIKGIQVYQGEAVRAGSNFFTGNRPAYQVPISVDGVFSPHFVGYGIRYKDVMIVPNHVYQDAVDANGCLILGDKQKMLVQPHDVKFSNRINDIVYLLFSPEVWARLGVTSARPIRTEKSASVNVYGPKGMSTGVAKKSTMPFLLEYSGSTVSGYSGAAYSAVYGFYGLHLGVVGGVNTGASAEALAIEVDKLFFGESRRKQRILSQPDSQDSGTPLKQKDNDWRAAQIVEEEEELEQRWREDPKGRHLSYYDWLDQQRESSNVMEEFISTLDSTTMALLLDMLNKRVRASTSYQPQSDSETVFVDALTSSEDLLEKELNGIKQRLQLLETKVAKLEGSVTVPPKPVVNGLRCPAKECEKKRKTYIDKASLRIHCFSAHGIVLKEESISKCYVNKKESANPTDSQVLVETKNSFLGKNRSPMERKPNLEKSSSLRPELHPFPSSQPSRSKPSVSLEELKKLSEELVRATTGLKEVLQRF